MKNKKKGTKIKKSANFAENSDSFANAPLDDEDESYRVSIIEGLNVKSMCQINQADSVSKLNIIESDAEDDDQSNEEIESIQFSASLSQIKLSDTVNDKDIIHRSQDTNKSDKKEMIGQEE